MEDYRLTQSGQEVQNILDGAAMQVDLTAETERATEAEQTLQGNIDIEERDRKAADLTLQGNIDAEELRAKAAEKQNADDIDALEEKVPSGASSSNKLATEGYVDDSVATATATFRGTYNLVSDLGLTVDATEQQIATALAGAISTADNNDYAFVMIPTSDETPTEIVEIDRYKFNGTAWAFEYALNNSGFTAAEWAAINSGITSDLVTKLGNLPTAAALAEALASKQNVLTFDSVPTEGSNNPVKSGGVYSAIDDEKVARQNSDAALQQAIEAILLLIPSAATSLNQLADKAFVNSSIATATATFRGTFNLVSDLHLTLAATHAEIGTALASAISDEDNNDYCFVQIPTSATSPTEIAQTDRYKFNGSIWGYEYTLNNSGFTSAQWTAINSGITSALVSKLSALPTNSELTTDLGTLSAAITAINQKIPAAAAQNNKLVDTAALESYIVQVLGVLTVSYNITSTDGHVTLAIQQTDGKITSVSLTTSDIASAAALNLKASQADLTALASRVTTAEGNITTLGGRVSTNETDIANLQQLYNNLQQSKPVPVTALPETGQQQGVIYRLAGTTSYSDYMWNGSTWVLMATYDNAIDDVPTAESNNLVKSGGVEKKLIGIELGSVGVDSSLTRTINATGNYKFFDVNFHQGTQFKLSISGSAVWTRMWFAYNNNAGRLKDFVANNNEYTITAPVDITSIEVYMYTMTAAGTVSLRLRTDSVIQKILDTGVFKEIGKNLFNKDDSSIKTGYYLNNEGDEVSGNTYSISPYIPFTEGYLVMSYGGTNAISGSGCLCCYNANKELVSSITITNSKGVIAWSTGVKYARFSYLNAYEEILQIEKGKYVTPYTPYGQYVPEADIEPSAKIPTISSQRTKGTLNANGNIELPVLYCRYAQNLSAIITGTISGSGVEVGRGRNAYNGGSITITATEIVIGAEHYAHGLTLTSKTFVMLTTDNSLQGKVVVMTSAGDKFEQEVSTSMGGAAYVKNNTGAAIDVELSFEPRMINSPIWLIGDSYMSYATTRWPYYLIHDWGLNNFLIDNLPGGNSDDMWASLWNLLKIGNPKCLVWALGMNGGQDEDGAVNADWLSYAEKFIFYCNERGIKPILTTVPSVPNLPHEKLNDWVRSSGYRYIDFAKAVNAQPDGTWDAGLLSSDNVHPTEAGAKVLASRVLIDFPEISIK